MGADLDSAQVWMPGEARRVVHSGKGDIGGREFLRQHRFIGSAEHGLDAAVGSRAAPDPLHVGRKRGIRSKRAIAQNLFREHPPFAVALDLAIEGCARPMRFGGMPASVCMSGTAIQSAIASNREIETAAPWPLRSRAISASRIAS